jgi:hypothetical protein
MIRLAAVLRRPRGGVFRLSARLDAAAAEAVAVAARLGFARADLSLATGKAALIGEVARALRFPDWFGGTWDSLQDAAGDLSWLPEGGFVLLLDGADAPAAAAPADWAMLIEVLASAAESRKGGRPLHILVRGATHPRLGVTG